MEILWTPWRLSYVTGVENAGSGGCVFCEAARPSSVHDDLVLVRGALCFVILNRYPYTNGHLMVVTNRHVATLRAAADEERAELIQLMTCAEAALSEAYNPQGLNVGFNLGRPAGAGIADHLHAHLVPRWVGDTSFISVVGHTRVLPEELGQTAARLRPIFERLIKGAG